MKFFTIILTIIAFTLAVKDECRAYQEVRDEGYCMKKCSKELIEQFKSEYPCLTEHHVYMSDRYNCWCSAGDEFFEDYSDCFNNCLDDSHDKIGPSRIKGRYCFTNYSLGLEDFDSISNAIRATATEPGKYLMSATFPDGYAWYYCLTIEESVFTTQKSEKERTTNSPNNPRTSIKSSSTETEITKLSSTETKSTENGAQFLGIPLISLIGIVLL